MTRDSGDFVSQLQELVSRALRQQVRSNQRVADLLRQISGGEMSGKDVGDALRRYSEQESAEYVRTLTTLGVSFFSNLLDLNQSFNERFFERIERQEENADAAPKKEAVARLDLRGATNTTVGAAFVVENQRDISSDVTMTFSPMVRADGSQIQAPIVARPAAFRLEPGEERSVEISLHLINELFVSGEQYHCQLLVRGTENMILDLVISVEAENAEPITPPVAPKKRKRAAKKVALKKAARKVADAKKAVKKQRKVVRKRAATK